MPNEKAIREQSKAAYGQWCKQWREQAIANAKHCGKSLRDFENIGIGKACLVVANGYSFEENIETIKAYKDGVDIMACDKTLGHLLDNGIKPTYVLVCDANVNYDKYMKKWEGQLEDTILIMNVCANPKWADNGNWKSKYFFVNRDIMNYEYEFMKLSGCKNAIPAGTNVSNAQVVMLTQSDDKGRNNFFGYDKLLCIGFDYSWEPNKSYYAYAKDAEGKANYMKHVYTVNANGKDCCTSTNLLFSAQWFMKYVNTFKLPVVQCSKNTIAVVGSFGDLKEQMQYNYKREDGPLVRNSLLKMNKLKKELEQLSSVVTGIGRDHYYSFIGTTH